MIRIGDTTNKWINSSKRNIEANITIVEFNSSSLSFIEAYVKRLKKRLYEDEVLSYMLKFTLLLHAFARFLCEESNILCKWTFSLTRSSRFFWNYFIQTLSCLINILSHSLMFSLKYKKNELMIYHKYKIQLNDLYNNFLKDS